MPVLQSCKTVQLLFHSHGVAVIWAGLSLAAGRHGLEASAGATDPVFAMQTFYGIFGVFMTPDLPAASVLSAMSYGMLLSGPVSHVPVPQEVCSNGWAIQASAC